MITGSAKYPHWTEDGEPRVVLMMTPEDADQLGMALNILSPYTGAALSELASAVDAGRKAIREDAGT